MEKYKDHPRYRKIDLNNGDGNYHYQAKRTLKIVLFKKARKLRSHTVKHLLNLEEFEKTWKEIVPIDEKLIKSAIKKLQEIECRYYSFDHDSPPCDAGRNGCNKFNKCANFISELDTHYRRASLRIIKEGGAIPRYVDYWSKEKNCEMFVLMSDRHAIIKARILEDNTYNLVTCYGDIERPPFVEMRDVEIRKVRKQARKNTIIWCDKNTWGIETSEGNANLESKIKRKKTNRKKMRQPYKRGGSYNWKQYHDESVNW